MTKFSALHIGRSSRNPFGNNVDSSKCVICGKPGCDREIYMFTTEGVVELGKEARMDTYEAHDTCLSVEIGGLLRAIAGKRLQ